MVLLEKFMETMTFKCPEKLAKWLQGESKHRKIAKSDLIRQAIEFFLLQKGSTTHASLYSLSKDLCGSLQGPEDLSENPAYLDGYGQ
jgi:Ribbon-helix-helix protein, copG family.